MELDAQNTLYCVMAVPCSSNEIKKKIKLKILRIVINSILGANFNQIQ